MHEPTAAHRSNGELPTLGSLLAARRVADHVWAFMLGSDSMWNLNRALGLRCCGALYGSMGPVFSVDRESNNAGTRH
jgi:hypothetical protein